MNRKYCHSCRRFSYSAKTSGRWLCPFCQRDLTNEKLLLYNEDLPEADKPTKGQLIPFPTRPNNIS